MPLINCSDCKNPMSDSAPSCPSCGKPNPSAPAQPKSVSLLLGAGILLVPLVFSWFTLRKGHSTLARVIAFTWLAVSIALVGQYETSDHRTATTPKQTALPIKSDGPTHQDGLTAPQRNAARAARQYLSMQGFSRDGLIHQLSSSYGDKYQEADAAAAVDSLNIDWNEQAVRSAKQYLSMQGFSCDGLIEQLSSSAGDKYSVAQATHGARQAGAC